MLLSSKKTAGRKQKEEHVRTNLDRRNKRNRTRVGGTGQRESGKENQGRRTRVRETGGGTRGT